MAALKHWAAACSLACLPLAITGTLPSAAAAGKDRLARLGDGERREAAAAMVFKLMQSLGVGSGSEDGSEGEDGDVGRASALASAG